MSVSISFGQTYSIQKINPQIGGGHTTGTSLKSINLVGQSFIGKSTGTTFEAHIGFFPIIFNQDPTALSIDAASITENLDSLSVVGTFSTSDPEKNDNHTYSLVNGTGDAGNSFFAIQGDQLLSNYIFDFEDQNSFSIRVQTDDGDGGRFEESFAISINDANDAPTNILLSSDSVSENLSPDALVGSLVTTDQDPWDKFTYDLVTGTGDASNAQFNIINDKLYTSTVFDYETERNYSIQIETRDSLGATFQKTFLIYIRDENDAPTDIQLSNTTRPENDPVGYVIGSFTTTDADSIDQFTYSIVEGEGDEDNEFFGISDDQLVVADTLNYELKTSYQTRIQTMDKGGEVYSESFTITISDINDPPYAVYLTESRVPEDAPVGTTVGYLKSLDEDDPSGLGVYTYKYPTGVLDNDAFRFEEPDEIVTARSYDISEQDTFHISVISEDEAGGATNGIIPIYLVSSSTNLAPTEIALEGNSFIDNDPVGTVIGTFTTTDPNPTDVFRYEWAAGDGDTHNDLFAIEGDQLKLNSTYDVTEMDTLSIRVRSTDLGDKYIEGVFSIFVIPFVDTLSPVLSNLQHPVTLAADSGEVSISVNVTDNDQVNDVWLNYKGILETEYDSVFYDSFQGTIYHFKVSADAFDEMGLQLYAEANDVSGNTAIQPGRENYIFIGFSQRDIPITVFGGKTEHYQIISIPYELENKSIESVFELNIGPYDKTKWRLVAYRNKKYVDYKEGLSDIRIGEGYWFNSLDKVNVSTGRGTVNKSIPHSLKLDPGWNLIGNPYHVSIKWDDVLANNNTGGKLSEVYLYNNNSKNYVTGNTINPFTGGFVFADSSMSVNIYPFDLASGGRMAGTMITSRDLDDSEWLLPVNLHNNNYTFEIGGIGMHQQARSVKDRYDRMTVPRFMYYLDFYSEHRDYFYPWFSTDIIPAQDEYRWRFNLESNFVEGLVELTWEQEKIRDNASQLWLIDEVNARSIDMKNTDTYPFTFNGKHRFSIFYSRDPNVAVVPSSITLGNAYPNPASSYAVIPVILSDIKDNYGMELVIYNLLGHQIKTLTKGKFGPGMYEFRWDGLDEKHNRLPDGVYIYRLMFDDPELRFSQKRLILQH